nr:hypothetical protein Hi04_10k_c2220_00035 [uncultured bacterium]
MSPTVSAAKQDAARLRRYQWVAWALGTLLGFYVFVYPYLVMIASSRTPIMRPTFLDVLSATVNGAVLFLIGLVVSASMGGLASLVEMAADLCEERSRSN